MKLNMKKIMAVAVAALSSAMAFAQNTNTAYFTDGYLFRHDLNPAFGNNQNYVALPALGNLNMSVRGNLGLSDVLYNVNGRTTTFMNPAVSASEVMGNINDKNKLLYDMRMALLSAGFKGFGGYNTIGVNVRGDMGLLIPGTLFSFLKEGLENKTYDISDFGARANAYVEIGLGHSHQINDQWRVGGTLKVLLGAANLDAKFNKAQLVLGENEWTAVTNAEINASLKGMAYETESKMRGPEGKETEHTYVSGLDGDFEAFNGFGLAVDLGAEFKLNDNLRFSAALLDLGFINWNNNLLATTNGDRTFTTDKYTFNFDDNASNSFENEADNMVEDLAALYELEDKGDQGSRSTGLGATMNIGAEYTLPSYRALSFGLMNSTRFNGDYSWTEFRLSTNFAPAKFFSMGVSVGAGTFGGSFGWIVNLHPRGFNFYAGMDRMLGSLSKQGVPLSSNASFNMGVNFPF